VSSLDGRVVAVRACIIDRVLCPKCGADLPDSETECQRCGVIFARFLEREEPFPHHVPHRVPHDVEGAALGFDHTSDVDRELRRLATLSGFEAATPSIPAAVSRGIFLLILALWTASLASGGVSAERVNGSFLHLPNLVFHEAGHILFIPFGRFMTVLGGSLTQVLVPLVCAVTFLWQTHDAFGAAVAIWWAGENLIDVAPYINDARDLQLVLLGGKTGAEVEGHDWEFLLNAMGVAHKDHAIAAIVQTIGTLTMVAALACGTIVVMNQIRRLRRGRHISSE
jgi:ribosomal protein L40E